MKNKTELLSKDVFDSGMKKLRTAIGGDVAIAIDVARDSKLKTMVETAVGDLALMVQKGFMATAKKEDLFALVERVDILEKDIKGMSGNFNIVVQQLKEIRKEIKGIDLRADVFDLRTRVNKLERKITLA